MTEEHRDTFFLDPRMAHHVALQANRVKVHHTNTGLQICYTINTPIIPAPPKNLIQMPLKDIISIFTYTPLRLPTKIVLINSSAEQCEAGNVVAQAIKIAQNMKENIILKYKKEISEQRPVFSKKLPLRIFAPTSRYTTVLQHCTRDLANTFKRLGHEVRFIIEENDMQIMSYDHFLKAQADFNPHITLNINHQNNKYLHPDIVNVTWWQDPVSVLTRGTPLHWRERDIIYSYCRQFDNYLAKTEAPRVERQVFCIDTEIFKVRTDIERRRKVVFIGSSYCKSLMGTPNEAAMAANLQSLLASGVDITEDMTSKLALRFNIEPHHAFWKVLPHVVRSTTVQWLCQHPNVEVEIYGRHWEEDEIVRPFFKGEVPHGPKVAEVYNGAKYALVCHSNEVQTQRLCEAAACGCIPVVYDCRYHAEPPFWDDYCLFFKTKQQLDKCLMAERETHPSVFSNYFSYNNFAKRILDRTWSIVEENNEPQAI